MCCRGVKRASERVGGPAADCAIYTMKGDTPRGHDHRARWEEMLDTCTGSGGTLDSGPPVRHTKGACRRGTIPSIRRRWRKWSA